MRSVELFAGAGGLALGMKNAGFNHALLVERDHSACETFRQNRAHYSGQKSRWPLREHDVSEIDYAKLRNIYVVSGGPPCQPFSLGGKHRGFMDKRDMFPEAVRAIRELRPRAFIFENVKGLLRQTFASYFEYILLQLTHPSFKRRASEGWSEHRDRLEKHQTSRRGRSEYNVVFRLLNAADFGVPQRRERVFIVGFRSDLGIRWSFPEGTHSEAVLFRSQWISGEYWENHRIPGKFRPTLTDRIRIRVEKLSRNPALEFGKKPWRTVRDAIHDLPDPEKTSRNDYLNHTFVPGARIYRGHTGSPFDEPAKTLKAGDHGVPGGENMLARADGSVRYFTVREAARLQTFPDTYEFPVVWTESMRQLGNAVPVALSETIATSVAKTLKSQTVCEE
ncbi:DNA cytosine methyltransferase [bacterium]|nr:DNA cytosine methyltransferase [bacterium]